LDQTKTTFCYVLGQEKENSEAYAFSQLLQKEEIKQKKSENK
jgi:hypothetical protein